MRKEKTVTIAAEGRDKGKIFLITEMSAWQAAKWADRCFFALAQSGVEIPEEIEQLGIAGIATLGLRALGGVKYPEAESLLDEMMGCVKFVDPTNPQVTRRLIEDDIEEVKTILTLRAEVFELHTGFSFAAALSNSQASRERPAAAPDQPPTT